MRHLLIVVFAFVLPICVNAQKPADSQESEQAKCKVRFAVYQLTPHVPGGMAPGMSKEQGLWYAKIKRKYPTVCIDIEKPDYFVLWSSRFSTEGTPEPAINFAQLTAGTGNSAVSVSGDEVSVPVESEYVYLSIFRAADVQRAQQDKSYNPLPVYFTQRDSWWTYRESHRKALEDALMFLKEEGSKR
jgi:hypothetical protein